jgi:cytochrome-b5 reductase
MSRALSTLEPGQTVWLRGPIRRFAYTRNMFRAVGMLGGGSGITPLYQLAQAIAADPLDRTAMHLIYANHTEGDILLRDQIAALPGLHTTLVLTVPPADWPVPEPTLARQPLQVSGELPAGSAQFASRGYVDARVLQAALPAPADDVRVLVCGPPGFVSVMLRLLGELGYQSKMLFVF